MKEITIGIKHDSSPHVAVKHHEVSSGREVPTRQRQRGLSPKGRTEMDELCQASCLDTPRESSCIGLGLGWGDLHTYVI